MSPPRPIMEDDLQAYVDEALSPARRAEVEAHLAAHPESAQRIAAYQRQRDSLRAALAGIAQEPVPPALSLAHLLEKRKPRRVTQPFWRMAAAAVVLLALGGAGGWSMRGPVSTTLLQGGINGLAQEAAYTYDVYSTDRIHPVEFRAADRSALLDWMADRLHQRITIPDLSAAGYRFMGGRLVATPHGPAGMLMYDDDHGLRLTMLVRPMTVDKTARMTEHSTGRVNGYAWAEKGVGYSLVGATSAAILHPLANSIRTQLAQSI